jgi:hypothetical protein
MMAAARRLMSCVAALGLAACAAGGGEAEFRVYAHAFDQVAQASGPLIATVASAERAAETAAIDAGETVAGEAAALSGAGVAAELRPAHAPYFATAGDPPFAAALRFGVEAIGRYNAALLAYAEGRALEAAQAELAPLAARGEALAVRFGGPSGTISAALAAAPGLAVAASTLTEGLRLAAAAGSRAAFRAELRERGGEIDRLIAELQEAGSRVFFLVVREDLEALEIAVATGDAATAAPLRARVMARRATVADWIVALAGARAALARAEAASDERPGSLATAAALALEIGSGAARVRDARGA